MEEWVTIAEAAKIAGVSTATLRRWDRSGRLRALRHPISGYRLYLRDRLESMVSASAVVVPQPTHMVGRREERAALESLLGRFRLVVVTGPPGIGKTALFRDALAGRDDAVVVDCSEVQDLAGFFGAVGQVASTTSETGILEWLAARPLVLGLDNLEQLLDCGLPEVLARWLAEAVDLRILGTSRRALRIREEHVLTVGPLKADAAGQVFERAGGRAFPQADIEELVTRLEGNPLALELAAAQADLLGPRELLAQLGPDVLTTDARDVPTRHTSIEAAVRASTDQLTAAEHRALSQLLVFRGGFEAVSAAAVLDVPAPLQVLRSLRRASLLRSWIANNERRHAPWAIVREVVAVEPLGSDVQRRHAEWLLDRLSQPGDVRQEAGNYRAVLERIDVSAPVRAAVFAASWSMVRTLTLDECIDIATDLLDSLGDLPVAASVLLVRGNAFMEMGRMEPCMADFGRGLLLVQNDRERINILLDRCLAHLRRPDTEAATADLDRAMALAERGGFRVSLARAYSVRSNVVAFAGSTRQEVVHALHEATQLARELGETLLELSNLAMGTRFEVALGIGRLDDALRAVALAREESNYRIEGYALETVGRILLDAGELPEAIATFREAREVCVTAGYARQGARAGVALAVGLLVAGLYEESEAVIREASAVFSPQGANGQCCRAIVALAAQLGGDADRAWRLIPDPVDAEMARDIVQVVLRLQGRESAASEEADREEALVRAILRIEAGSSASLRIASDGSWFQTPGLARTELAAHPVLTRILSALANAERPLNVDDLIDAAWPELRLIGDSGAKRVRSAVWKLRRLGLKGYLRTSDEGYFIQHSSEPLAKSHKTQSPG